MTQRSLVRFCLILMAVTIPLSIIALTPRYPTKREMEREIEMSKVFAMLSEWQNYNQIDSWCGLASEECSSQQSAEFQHRVESDTNPSRVWCRAIGNSQTRIPARGYLFPTNVRWYRLRHPTDRKQYIGIGVIDQHNTGWTAHWIRCRVPVGFDPDADKESDALN